MSRFSRWWTVGGGGSALSPAAAWASATEFAAFDAERKFALESVRAEEPAACRAGEVLRGRIKPFECAAFGTVCTPEFPLGAPMVSSEGACAAYYSFGRFGRPAAGH